MVQTVDMWSRILVLACPVQVSLVIIAAGEIQAASCTYLHDRRKHIPLYQICQETGLVRPGCHRQGNLDGLLSYFDCTHPVSRWIPNVVVLRTPSPFSLLSLPQGHPHSPLLPFRIMLSSDPTKSVKMAST